MRGKTICDYSSPRNNATWICERPPSKKCAPIIGLHHKQKYEEWESHPHTRIQRVCKTFGCHVHIKERNAIKVLKSDNFVYENYWANLPYCKELFQKNGQISFKKTSLQITGQLTFEYRVFFLVISKVLKI